MLAHSPFRCGETGHADRLVDVTLVMPCLNEAESLAACLINARHALDRIEAELGLTGEIVVADNGSVDASRQIAHLGGARVVSVERPGYGAALIGGFTAARGRFLLMGDADGSYDFDDGVAMIGQLAAGVDLCMGTRFEGGIAPGAMPWKNRYIGNPILTGALNLFFKTRIGDAHCGLRAITKSAFESLGLSGQGMEFASEMLIKASLKELRIVEVPVTLSPDLRSHPPHLRPWRDGWRHLRYLLMLSPTWVFGIPALASLGSASVVLLTACLHLVGVLPGEGPFGTSWTLLAGFLFTCGHFGAITALATHFHGVKQGYRFPRPILTRYAGFLTLESWLICGFGLCACALGLIGAIAFQWSQLGYTALPNILPLVLAAVMGAVGLQTIFGGFLLAIIVGHVAEFACEANRSRHERSTSRPKDPSPETSVA